MSEHDCLIWVGESYKSVEHFMKEAVKRGCCRKVAFWPSWAAPGRTRVFLAHHGGFRSASRGVLFGYYRLGGVDVVMTQRDCDEYKALWAEHAVNPAGGRDERALRRYWKTAAGRERAEPLLEFWRKRFGRRDLPCHIPARKRAPRDPLEDAVIDFLLDFLISCEPGAQPHGHNGYGISTDQTRLETKRDCPPTGLRDRPRHPGERPSIYLVDKLERVITEEFCDLLKEILKSALEKDGERRPKRPQRRRRELVGAKAREQILAALRRKAAAQPDGRRGIDEFRDIVAECHLRKRLHAHVPAELGKIAQARGAMVVFKEPQPLFRLVPRAAVRGVKRMDGEELLWRVRKAYSEVRRGERPDIVLPVWSG